MGWLWILASVIGVTLLGVAMFYAWRSNKNDSPAHIAEAEQGAKALRDELEQDESQPGRNV